MRLRLLLGVLIAAVLAFAVGVARAGSGAELIAQPEAARHGLVRAWYAQAQLDAGRGRVTHLVLDRGTLFVQTDRAMLQAIDAETGQTLWARIVGRADHPSLRPAAGPGMVAVINGIRLYVLNRATGDILFETRVDGAPGAGPALSEKRAYVPMVDGMILAYRLEPVKDPTQELGRMVAVEELPPAVPPAGAGTPAAGTPPAGTPPSGTPAAGTPESSAREGIRLRQEFIPPLACRSTGRALVPPTVTWQSPEEEYVAWPTDAGFLFVGRIDRRAEDNLDVKYRLDTVGTVPAEPAYLPPDPSRARSTGGTLFFVSDRGYVRAVEERTGKMIWRFTTGEPARQPAVLIDDAVYVANQFGGMYCLDAKTGSQRWFTPGIVQLVAVGNQRLYAVDLLGNLQILSVKTGTRFDSFSVLSLPLRLTNTATDRIYLASETGLVQCLREIELAEPLLHNQPPGQDVEPQADQPPPGGAQPGRPAQPAQPGGAQPDDADPFGGGGTGRPAAPPRGGAPAEREDAAPEPVVPADPFSRAVPRAERAETA